MPDQNVLVIDDEKHLCDLFTEILSRDGHRVQTAGTGNDGLALLGDFGAGFSLVFLDMMLPDSSGNDILREIKRRNPALPVVMMTGFASKESAVEAMRLGAYDYLAKPFNISDVSLIASRALERTRLIDENRYLREELRERYNFDNIVGSSEKIQSAYVLAAKIANQNATVLITGESGTGKEMLARTIHYQSGRADRPFVKVNCAALPEHLLEDELFGHEKGSFTDAHTQRIGRFEWAHTGTLFLDEIGEIALPVQVKLLRVLQEREFERIGSSKTIKVDVRIIAATNRDLEQAIAEGNFREDLFYRLNVVPIELPPLRERPEDIPQLVEHFIQKYCTETGCERMDVSADAMQVLTSQPWRGNIRELENCIERAVILSDGGVIEPHHLLLAPGGLNVQAIQARAVSQGKLNGSANGATEHGASADVLQTLTGSAQLPTLEHAMQLLAQEALKRSSNNQPQAAQMLGISIDELCALLTGASEDAAEASEETPVAKPARPAVKPATASMRRPAPKKR